MSVCCLHALCLVAFFFCFSSLGATCRGLQHRRGPAVHSHPRVLLLGDGRRAPHRVRIESGSGRSTPEPAQSPSFAGRPALLLFFTARDVSGLERAESTDTWRSRRPLPAWPGRKSEAFFPRSPLTWQPPLRPCPGVVVAFVRRRRVPAPLVAPLCLPPVCFGDGVNDTADAAPPNEKRADGSR